MDSTASFVLLTQVDCIEEEPQVAASCHSGWQRRPCASMFWYLSGCQYELTFFLKSKCTFLKIIFNSKL